MQHSNFRYFAFFALLLCGLPLLTASLSAQLVNGDFEQADDTFGRDRLIPAGWSARGGGFMLTKDAYKGKYAMVVHNWYMLSSTTARYTPESDNKWIPDEKSLLEAGRLNFRPLALEGFFKYTHPETKDSRGEAHVIVFNEINGKIDTVGTGTFIFSASDKYQAFSIPIQYRDEQSIPSRISISFFSGHNLIPEHDPRSVNEYNYLHIDQLSLKKSTGSKGEIASTWSDFQKLNHTQEFARNNLLLIRKKGKLGVASPEGKVIIPAKHDRIYPRKNYFVVIDSVRQKTSNRQLRVSTYNLKGEVLIQPDFYIRSRVSTSDFIGKELGIWGLEVDGKHKMGLVGSDGNWILRPIYDRINNFWSAGQAVIKMEEQFGMIDTNGTLIIPFSTQSRAEVIEQFDNLPEIHLAKYKQIRSTSEGLTPVSPFYDFETKAYGKIWGFADQAGKLVIPIKYSTVSGFHNGLSLVSIKDKKGMIDKNGQVVIPVEFEEVSSPIGGRIFANKGIGTPNPKSVLFDLKGNEIRSFSGTLISPHHNPADLQDAKLLGLSQDGKGTFYLSEGIELIQLADGKTIPQTELNYLAYVGEGLYKFISKFPFQHHKSTENILVEDMGASPVAQDLNFGVLDSKGMIVVQPGFVNIGRFDQQQAYVLRGNTLHILSATGEVSRPIPLDMNWAEEASKKFNLAFGDLTPKGFGMYQGVFLHDGKAESMFPASARLTQLSNGIFKVTTAEGAGGFISKDFRELIYWEGTIPVL